MRKAIWREESEILHTQHLRAEVQKSILICLTRASFLEDFFCFRHVKQTPSALRAADLT